MDINGVRAKTNASGEAVLNLRAGTYTAKVKKVGYTPVTETITVASAAVEKTITMTLNA